MATYRYVVGIVGQYDNLEPMFEVKSNSKLESSVLLDRMYAALEATGFPRVSPPKDGPAFRLGFSIEERCVCSFRGSEFELEANVVEQQDVDRALSQLGPDEVFVVTCRMAHSSGTDYDYRLLAVPRGSQCMDKTFDDDVNWICTADSNAEWSMTVPGGSRIWRKGRWKPVRRLHYSY